MKILKTKNQRGDRVLINLDNVAYMVEAERGTLIAFTDKDDYFVVPVDIDTIEEYIEAKFNNRNEDD